PTWKRVPKPEAARSKTWTGSCHGTSARSKGGRGDVKMRSRRRTHHSHVAWSGSDEEFQSQTPQPAWDAAWDRVRAERKQAGLPNTYKRVWNSGLCMVSPELRASREISCIPVSFSVPVSFPHCWIMVQPIGSGRQPVFEPQVGDVPKIRRVVGDEGQVVG